MCYTISRESLCQEWLKSCHQTHVLYWRLRNLYYLKNKHFAIRRESIRTTQEATKLRYPFVKLYNSFLLNDIGWKLDGQLFHWLPINLKG
jgi:hypothetical protein